MAATVALQPSSNINILTFYPKIIIYHRISAEKCIEMKRLIVRALMLQKSKNIIFQKPFILPLCSSTQHFFIGFFFLLKFLSYEFPIYYYIVEEYTLIQAIIIKRLRLISPNCDCLCLRLALCHRMIYTHG